MEFKIIEVKCSFISKNISKHVKLLKYNLENEDFLLMLHNELNGLKNLFGCTFTTPKKFHECNFSLI